jgi:hypothetical protein
MKKIRIVVMIAITLVMVSTGYTATEDEEPTDSSPTTGSEGMPGMMSGMQGKGMMHQGMMGHHMMHSGMSPVTVFISPGMMPMMGHGMKQRGTEGGHKGGGMSREKMEQRQSMMKKHMERMEQRLENIEALLGELVELQKKD